MEERKLDFDVILDEINYLLDICRGMKEGQMGIDLQKRFQLVTTPGFASSRHT
jgi:hypothetical protein